MTRSIFLLLLLFFVTGATSACTSSMAIYSRPSGAKVVMDKTKPLGQTPILLREQTWIWTRHTFTFTQEGYAPQTIKVSAKARPANMVLAVCGTSCCLWPIALLGQLPRDIVAQMAEDQIDPFDAVEKTTLQEQPEISFE